MFCSRCQNHVLDCECDDIEERLRALSRHPGFETDRCANCSENRVDCTCETYSPITP